MVWLQKAWRYGSRKQDITRSQNVQNTQQSHKVYQENHEILESGIDRRKKKITWGKDPERYIFKEMSYHHYYL